MSQTRWLIIYMSVEFRHPILSPHIDRVRLITLILSLTLDSQGMVTLARYGRVCHELQRLAHLWSVLCAPRFVHYRQYNGDNDNLIRTGRMVWERCAMASSRGRCFFPVPPPLASTSIHRNYFWRLFGGSSLRWVVASLTNVSYVPKSQTAS